MVKEQIADDGSHASFSGFLKSWNGIAFAVSVLMMWTSIGATVLLISNGISFDRHTLPREGSNRVSSKELGSPEIDEAEGKALSDLIVQDLLHDDYANLRQKMPTPETDEQFVESFQPMYKAFGKPLAADYKMSMPSSRKDLLSGNQWTGIKYWYAVETTKNKKGTHFLTIEIVDLGEGLICSRIEITIFPLGDIPEELK